jgi:hypothetical protein
MGMKWLYSAENLPKYAKQTLHHMMGCPMQLRLGLEAGNLDGSHGAPTTVERD